METEIRKLIDSLEVTDEKRKWIEQYAIFHANAEKNPPLQQKPIEKEFFEIPDAMKSFWKERDKLTF